MTLNNQIMKNEKYIIISNVSIWLAEDLPQHILYMSVVSHSEYMFQHQDLEICRLK